MSLYIVDIHGELEGDYEIIKKYEEPTTKNNLGVDLISRNEVLNRLASIAKIKAKSDAQKSLMGRCMFMVERMPSITPQEPKWIPVSEKLPEIHNYTENYLVTLKRGGVYTAMFTECNGKHWWTYDDVIAWMSLPKSYSEVEE